MHEDQLAEVDDQRKKILEQHQRGEVDDLFLEEELGRIRRDRERLARRPNVPELVQPAIGDLPGICAAAQRWVSEAGGEDIVLLADALSLVVTASKESAEMVRVIPDFTYHWTNIGMTARPRVKMIGARKLPVAG